MRNIHRIHTPYMQRERGTTCSTQHAQFAAAKGTITTQYARSQRLGQHTARSATQFPFVNDTLLPATRVLYTHPTRSERPVLRTARSAHSSGQKFTVPASELTAEGRRRWVSPYRSGYFRQRARTGEAKRHPRKTLTFSECHQHGWDETDCNDPSLQSFLISSRNLAKQ